MGLCENGFKQVVEWLESDLLMNVMTNEGHNILHQDWKKSERQGHIRYGNLLMDFRKDFFRFELTAYQPYILTEMKKRLDELNINYKVRDLSFATDLRSQNLSYDKIEIIIKLLEFT